MKSDLENTIDDLYKAYLKYYQVSKNDSSDYVPEDLADMSVGSYIRYVLDMCNIYPEWKEDLVTVFKNEIRILEGFAHIYDRPVKRDPITSKSRWSK